MDSRAPETLQPTSERFGSSRALAAQDYFSLRSHPFDHDRPSGRRADGGRCRPGAGPPGPAGGGAARQRHPSRAQAPRAAGALPDRRRDGRSGNPAGLAGAAAALARQGSRPHGYDRAPPAAGRAVLARVLRRRAGAPARLDLPGDPWRDAGAARAARPSADPARTARPRRRTARCGRAADRAPLGPGAGVRSYRQRQDLHALFDPATARHRGHQRGHARGSDRGRVCARDAGPGQRPAGVHLCHRPARHPAAGSRRDHGRRCAIPRPRRSPCRPA
jgi:hypothetical protein